jgi:hypothetical protein
MTHLASTTRPTLTYWLFLLVLACVTLSASCLSQQDYQQRRALSTLAEKFNITVPTYEYANLNFKLEYAVSDFIQDENVEYELYDQACRDNNGEVPYLVDTDTTLIVTVSSSLLSSSSSSSLLLLLLLLLGRQQTMDWAGYCD